MPNIKKLFEKNMKKISQKWLRYMIYPFSIKNNIPIGMVLFNDLDEKNISKFFNKIKSNIYKRK